MLRDSLERLDLYCTACRVLGEQIVQHKLNLVPEVIQGDFVLSGHLECPNCGKTYGIIEGVPCLIDESPSSRDVISQYLDSHYGIINKSYWSEINKFLPGKMHLDAGCSVGRYTFECAKKSFSVGIDTNLEALKLAARFQRTGRVGYKRKTRTLFQETMVSDFVPSRNVLFIMADIHNPPFAMETFETISALNLIDSVRYPLTAIGQIDALLAPEGRLLLSSPYIWDSGVTGQYLETEDTDSHSYILQMLTGKRIPEYGFNYVIEREMTGLPWRMRRIDNLEFTYYVDIIVAEKRSNLSC